MIPYISAAAGFLKSAKGIASAIVILGVAIWIGLLHHKVKSLEAEKDNLNRQIGQYVEAVSGCNTAIDELAARFQRVSDEITTLKRMNESQKKKIREADRKVGELEREKQRLLLEYSREEVGKTCEEAINWLLIKEMELSQWSK